MSTVGILALARATFDTDYATGMLDAMLGVLDRTGHRIVGSRKLLFDAAETRAAMRELETYSPDQVLVLQVTFTDAAMATEIGGTFDVPLSIWAVPEPRTGGRLRLNSLCGLNLAAHALGLDNRTYGYLFASPGSDTIAGAVGELLAGHRTAEVVAPRMTEGAEPTELTAALVESLKGTRIACIGSHPEGFDTCRYDPQRLQTLAGVEVDEIPLDDLFSAGRHADAGEVAQLASEVGGLVDGLGDVDASQLDKSMRLKLALDTMRAGGNYDAFAIRCWPETFTEYGGAVCGPVSMMGEARVPCACEADVYGALTALVLQKVAGSPPFLADLVDMDQADDTGVFWHCGQAPLSMAANQDRPRATVHTNRRMPLLFEFALKPGRITFFRLSQARGRTMAVIGGGDMLERPMAFTGTSGVVRFDNGARRVLDHIMGAALEHHFAMAYGDHRAALADVARGLGLPVLEI